MTELARTIVFDTEKAELTINGEVFPFEIVEVKPSFENRSPRGFDLVPALQVTILGSHVEFISAHGGP